MTVRRGDPSRKLHVPFVGLDRAGWVRLCDRAALLATILVGGAMVLGTFFWFGVDFRAFYAAGRLLVSGQDPYDYELTVPILLEVSGEVGNAPFYYPPWFALLMVPFALFPYSTARILWLVLSIVVWGLSVWFALSALDWQVRGWRLWLMILSLLYLLVWVCIRSEQTGPLICFFLTLALWSIKKGHPVLTGIALTLILTKPQVIVLAWPLLVVIAFRRHRWQVIISLLVCLIGLLVFSTLVIPGWYKHVLRRDFGLGLKSMVEGPDIVIGKRLTSTLPDLLWYLGLSEPIANVVWAVVSLLSIGGLFMLWFGGAGLLYILILSMPIWFLITPYSMQYDYVLMTLAMIWIYRELGKAHGWRFWVGVGGLIFIHSTLLWIALSVESLWLPVSVGLLLIGLRFGSSAVVKETL